MLIRVANKVSRLLGRLPDPDAHDTAVPYLNAVYEQVMRAERRTARSNYTWAMTQASFLASSLGVERISVIELGVAGGNGLIAMERAAARLEPILGVAVDVYGFDTGRGLPASCDFRDLPHLWPAGGYPMNERRLRARLERATLVLGLVQETLGRFLASGPAPIGFVAFDLDHYTSTRHALALLEAEDRVLMPRIHCYFDDILGYSLGHHNGERLAISEFNASHADRPISRIYGLRYCLPRRVRDANWTEKMYMAHIVTHPLYARWDGMVRRARMDLAVA